MLLKFFILLQLVACLRELEKKRMPAEELREEINACLPIA